MAEKNGNSEPAARLSLKKLAELAEPPSLIT